MDEIINELVKAVDEDRWCQECGLEHVAPAVLKLLNHLECAAPDWLIRMSERYIG